MALIKTIKNQYGVPVTYWRIVSVNNVRNGDNVDCTININGYYDKQAKLDGCPHLMELSTVISMPVLTPIPNINMLSAFYYKVKENCPELIGAEDDLEEED